MRKKPCRAAAALAGSAAAACTAAAASLRRGKTAHGVLRVVDELLDVLEPVVSLDDVA